jgi:hypothetical protein
VTDTVTAIDVDHLAMDVDLATMALAPIVANRAIERKGKAHVPNKEMTMDRPRYVLIGALSCGREKPSLLLMQ